MGTQMLKVFSYSAQNMSFASTDCFGPHNIDKRIMVKKAVKRYRSNNLKNDCESKEINSQEIGRASCRERV